MDVGILWELMPENLDLRLASVDWSSERIAVNIEMVSPTAACPRCQEESTLIRGRYERRIQDLPCCGMRFEYVVTVRKFRCGNAGCKQSVFCERIDDLAAPHARTSRSLTESQEAIGFSAGGEGGARLAEKLGMPTSPDTLLRRVKAAADEPGPPPRYVGVDDWSFRKGHSYGTILIDLERRCVIDIFPERDGKALEEWFRANPQVEVISRDRWPAYAEAATNGAPQAKQVADRWHLLQNLREAMERLFARFGPNIREVLNAQTEKESQRSAQEEATLDSADKETRPCEEPVTQRPPTAQEQRRQAKQEEREQQFQRVHELHRQGCSNEEIARRTGLSKHTVARYLREEKCPDWTRSQPTPNRLDDYAVLIDEWIESGEGTRKDLLELLRQQGCQSSYEAVCAYVKRRLANAGRSRPDGKRKQPVASRPLPTARKLSYEFLRSGNRDGGTLPTLCEQIPVFHTGVQLGSELAAMFRQELSQPLADWLAKAKESGIPEMQNMARSIEKDKEAVEAATTEPWSNGPVEGQVNRLKMIKRTMYGRAGMKLLRARIKKKT